MWVCRFWGKKKIFKRKIPDDFNLLNALTTKVGSSLPSSKGTPNTFVEPIYNH